MGHDHAGSQQVHAAGSTDGRGVHAQPQQSIPRSGRHARALVIDIHFNARCVGLDCDGDMGIAIAGGHGVFYQQAYDAGQRTCGQ